MHVEIKHICVPTDFSEPADHAVHYAAALAHQHSAELHLLHVLESAAALAHHPDFSAQGEVAQAYFRKLEESDAPVATAEDLKRGFVEAASGEAASEPTDAEPAPSAPPTDETLVVHQFLKSLETGANEQLSAAGQDWWEELTVKRVVRFGHPVEAICHYAGKQAIDLIVMSTHGRSGLTRLMMGSVAERVLRVSPCPVLVVRHPDHRYTIVE